MEVKILLCKLHQFRCFLLYSVIFSLFDSYLIFDTCCDFYISLIDFHYIDLLNESRERIENKNMTKIDY